MATVRLEGVSRRFADAVAIEDISFQVPDGAFWVLVGPSGCGKSTILRTIAGLEPVSEGQLYIGDHRVNQVAARQRDVAMVFQNYALYPHMSVADNLGFGLRMRQVPPGERRSRIEQVARSLGIAHLLDRKPGQLSGGQQQRVALGRAIARQPQVFLLDEPLSNLDAQLRDDTRTELKQLHQTFGITTIYVTHDQVEAMTLADRMVVLDQGRIQQMGTPQDIYNFPTNRMVATFTGSPPMNLLQATFGGDHFRIGDQPLPCPASWQRPDSLLVDRPLHLGIRPEHICLVRAQDDVSQLAADGHLRALVDLVEPLGRENLVRVTLPPQDEATTAQTLMVLVEPSCAPAAQEPCWLRLSLEHLFGFDLETGQRLFPQYLSAIGESRDLNNRWTGNP